MVKEFISLDSLDVYKLSRYLSKVGWNIYKKFDWQAKKIIGDQFIESTDSVGANISEGYGRFHYLDKVKFYYNARGSLFESKHWIDLLHEREYINEEIMTEYLHIYNNLVKSLNGLIRSVLITKKVSTNV